MTLEVLGVTFELIKDLIEHIGLPVIAEIGLVDYPFSLPTFFINSKDLELSSLGC